MASILTNNSAITALQTLRSINQNLAMATNEVATGKRVPTAKENAAFFAISAVMDSDVKGFKAVNESLALGDATLAVARSGAETTTELLNELKGRIVAAQDGTADPAKIQADVAELRNQVVATIDASQFNGQNLLQGDTQSATVSILASLNRSAGGVTTSEILVERQSLEVASTVNAAATVAAGVAADTVVAATLTRASRAEGDVIAVSLTNALGEGVILSATVTAADLATTTDDLFAAAIAARLDAALDASGLTDADGTILTVTTATNNIRLSTTTGTTTPLTIQSAIGGGLSALSLVDVSTEAGAAAALTAAEDLIQKAVNGAAVFGSAQKRVEIQSNFNAKIADSLTSGIGALVDADLEAASARLQALQVQQQLGVQALSIANQQPQSILSLFR